MVLGKYWLSLNFHLKKWEDIFLGEFGVTSKNFRFAKSFLSFWVFLHPKIWCKYWYVFIYLFKTYTLKLEKLEAEVEPYSSWGLKQENEIRSHTCPYGHLYLEAQIDYSLNRFSRTHAAVYRPLLGVSHGAQVCEDARVKYTGLSGCEFWVD